MKRLGTLLAAVVALVLMWALALGMGPVPSLGAALNPGGGVWSAAAGGELPQPETLDLPGLAGSVRVSFDANGIPSVSASSDHDLFLAQGYLQATFRLTELDLERRTAEGTLSQLVESAALGSDEFELQSGLLRTAEAEWAATPIGSPARDALLAYSQGVNDLLAQVRRNGQWPSVFTLEGVYPSDWTPVDSLAIQELLTQDMDYSTAPLQYAVLNSSLGPKLTSAWFPVNAPDGQHPYDPGPYRYLGVTRVPASANVNASVPGEEPSGGQSTAYRSAAAGASTSAGHQAEAASAEQSRSSAAAEAILSDLDALPASQIHTFSDSNAWAADGSAVEGGKAMLAGDPHLQLTLPSYWYEMALSSPETEASGASMVGLPGILIGRNAHISWSLTDVQNQSTVFYTEQTSPSHPDEYYWDGAWRAMEDIHYTIPVRGGATVPFTVQLTVHGPVMTQDGKTESVDWMGNIPSPDMAAVLAIDKARDYTQFRNALTGWVAPTLNFVYADDSGNIGVMAAGYSPLTRAGDAWLPLSGTGADDVIGIIPFAAMPQSYDPPGHVLATANQRPVAADYPYYIGTTLDGFDNGYRADAIYQYLDSHSDMTPADFSALQDSTTDYLATLIVPALHKALQRASLSGLQRQALGLLDSWNGSMTATSTAASVWWTFWNDYLFTVFQPWWSAAKVPATGGTAGPAVSSLVPSLDEDLEAWTLNDPDDAAFSGPSGARGDATSAMRTAFERAVADLSRQLGASPADWQWGSLHTRSIPSLTGANGLGYGPFPAGGDPWTANAADGGMDSSYGPSWRMVARWTGQSSAEAEAIYPGGQSENPASPWYDNLVQDWWDGRLLPLPTTEPSRSGITWTLRPGG
jgi:penicillin amidase